MFRSNLKLVALSIPKIIGGARKIWAGHGYAHAPFAAKFLMGFCSDGPYECSGLESIASPVPEIIAIGTGLQTPNLGEEEAVGGRGWYHSKERQ